MREHDPLLGTPERDRAAFPRCFQRSKQAKTHRATVLPPSGARNPSTEQRPFAHEASLLDLAFKPVSPVMPGASPRPMKADRRQPVGGLKVPRRTVPRGPLSALGTRLGESQQRSRAAVWEEPKPKPVKGGERQPQDRPLSPRRREEP